VNDTISEPMIKKPIGTRGPFCGGSAGIGKCPVHGQWQNGTKAYCAEEASKVNWLLVKNFTKSANSFEIKGNQQLQPHKMCPAKSERTPKHCPFLRHKQSNGYNEGKIGSELRLIPELR
jgi:hypothetical protein